MIISLSYVVRKSYDFCQLPSTYDCSGRETRKTADVTVGEACCSRQMSQVDNNCRAFVLASFLPVVRRGLRSAIVENLFPTVATGTSRFTGHKMSVMPCLSVCDYTRQVYEVRRLMTRCMGNMAT